MQVEEVRAWTVLGSGLYAIVGGDGQARSPKKVQLVNGGSDRSPG